MSKRESKHVLSPSGVARKKAMLGQLQEELAGVHHRRQQRNSIAKGVALATVIGMVAVALLVLAPRTSPENRIAEGVADATGHSRAAIASTGNVEGINDKYLVANSDSSAEFETVSDDELLALMSAAGQPSVLAEIDGKVRVIPDSIPKRKI